MDDWERPKETLPKVENKWEGEDQEEEVKDSWEDEEEEEKKDVEKPQVEAEVEKPKSAASKKPKKALAEKIDEKERKLLEETQRKEEAKQKLLMKNLTPEQLAAERLRQRKLQEENELELVKATYGVDETPLASIDKANPVGKEEFDKLREAMTKKIKDLSTSEHFSSFATQLIQSIGPCLSVTELREVSSSFSALATEKSKMDKPASSKKKGKQRAKLNRADDIGCELSEYVDDFDGFI